MCCLTHISYNDLPEFPSAALSSIDDATASPHSFALQAENSFCVIILKVNGTDTPLRNAPGEDGFCLGIPFGRDGNSLDFLKNLCQRAPYYSIQGATSRKKHISGEGRGKTPVLSEVFSSLVPLRISPSESAPERRYVSSDVSPAFLQHFSYFSQRPEAPQGRVSPFWDTGSPTSSALTVPPNFGTISTPII